MNMAISREKRLEVERKLEARGLSKALKVLRDLAESDPWLADKLARYERKLGEHDGEEAS
jgi:hypothetical protein